MKPLLVIHAEFCSENLSVEFILLDLFHQYQHSLKITERPHSKSTSCNIAMLRFKSNTK